MTKSLCGEFVFVDLKVYVEQFERMRTTFTAEGKTDIWN